ncbi:MAG: immunoglobulin domain-containing protein [Chthoniobacteraceae bacterium]
MSLDVTSAVGSGTRALWTLGIVQSTTITHNAGAAVLLQLTENNTQSVEVSGIRFIEGSARDGQHLRISGVSGGKPVIIHNCWFSTAGPMLRSIETSVNRGIIYKCSFDSGFYSGNGNGIGNDDQAIGFKNDQNSSAWTEASKMGMNDLDGLGNFYVEDCYFAGIYLQTMDFDGNARAVVRYCIFNNSAMSSHGADTGPVGARHYQIYNNNFVFNDIGALTYPLDYVFFIRGGTGVIADNVLADMQSTQWGTKPAIKMTVMNLRRNAGPNPCWNQGYPAPRQVGMGRVTGNGGNDSITYAGDSEPLYIWNNLGNPSAVTTDFGGSGCTSSASSSAYIQAGRDYFNNGTAKPGWVKYTYPHPLRGGGQAQGVPVITGNPQSLMCVVGQSLTLSVSASGAAPLSYQWQKGRSNIAGATGATYTISTVGMGDAGDYRCVVINSAGSTFSAEATITVSATSVAPTITGSPQALSRGTGETAAFSITAAGTAPLAYQWQKNQADIGGATSATFTILSVQTVDAGSYRCVVSNGSGSAVSVEAALIVAAPVSVAPVISTNPQPLTRAVGQSATFAVTAVGTAPIAYQWQKNGVNILGATAATYTIGSVSIGDAGNYRCVVSNSSGTITSSEALLTVNAAAVARTYYVDDSVGSDSNPGTAASPWRRCPGMVGWAGSATLQAGDKVYFNRAGTWSMGQNPSGPGLELKRGVHYVGNEWNPSGGESRRAVLRAIARHETGVVRFWEDDTSLPTWLQGFEIDGNNQRTNLIDINHSYWRTGLTNAVKRIEDCVAHGNTGNGSEGDYKYGIIVSDGSPDGSGHVSNVEILNTVVYDVARDAICLYPGSNGMISNILVRGCEAYNTGRDPSYSEGHGLLIKGNVRNAVIEFCFSHDVKASAAFVNGPEYGSGPGPSNCVLRYCVLQTVDNNGVIRFYGTGSKSVDIFGNIILPNEAGGGLSFAGNSGSIAARVFNNTFYNSFVDIGNPNSTGSIDFRNNIIYELDDVPFSDSGSDVTGHSNNVFFRVGAGTLVSVGAANYNAGNILGWEPTARSSDPLFRNSANLPTGFSGAYPASLAPNRDGLSLQAGSGALNTGADLGGVFGGSINSRLRPVDGAWDIGAYEGMSSGSLSAPVARGLPGPGYIVGP